MDAIAAALETVRSYAWVKTPMAPIARYLETGDPADLEKIGRVASQEWWLLTLADPLARPSLWQARHRRLLHALARMGAYNAIGGWFRDRLRDEEAGEDLTAAVTGELTAAGLSDDDVLGFLLNEVDSLISRRDGSPTSAGRRVLSASDGALERALRGRAAWPASHFAEMAGFVALMLAHAVDRLPPLVPAILIPTRGVLSADVLRLLLAHDQQRYEPDVLRFLDDVSNGWERYNLGRVIFAVDRERYGKRAWDAALEALAMDGRTANHGPVATWLVAGFGAQAVVPLADYVKRSDSPHWSKQVIEAVSSLGDAGLPVLIAGLTCDDTRPRLAALSQLIALGGEAHDAVIEPALRRGLEGDPGAIIQCLALAARWRPSRIEDVLWKLLEHSSKPVREAAARAIARTGEPAVARAIELLGNRKADVRGAAVIVLATVGSAAAMAALEARADQETSDDVRDQILVAVEEVRRREGRPVDRAAIAARVARVEAKLAKPVADWLDEEKLPTLRWQDGAPVDQRTVRWLLHRQSRARGMAADVEARPLLALLDRAGAGGFARAMLDAFLAAGARSDDRWALALAGLLGDDNLVPILAGRIREWVDANRGKLAEYAVQALALLGSDAALLAVDAMSIRYRSKMKNVGRAAAEAFAAAAEALGIEPDELGDRVVPWLGFEPGKPRIVDAGKVRVEISVGLDLKLAFKDASTGKRMAAFPKSAPAATEIKETAASLKEVVKGQLVRMEGVFTRQRRWPVSVWRTLFLGHPLLRPFAVRLVWGSWDGVANVEPRATFRALEDLSLTTADDDPYTLPDAGNVGIVHPLELSPHGLDAWRRHLADHEVEAPFPQIERDIVRARPEEAAVGFYRAVEGTKLNAMTFKGRAERLGWHRGSVCDAGMIPAYVKSFPAGQIEVILALDGFFIGAGIDDQVTLGTACFVKAGAVQFGSYVYDDPSKEDDPRVVPLGEVPAIPFSETLADLRRIAETSSGPSQ